MPDRIVRGAPHIRVYRHLPEVEYAAAYSVQSNLQAVASHTNDFDAALKLHDFCRGNLDQMDRQCEPGNQPSKQQQEMQALLKSWLPIAGRDAAMAIYHFGIAAEGARRALSMCPTLSGTVLHPELRHAIRGFRSDFPTYEKIRHAVAHAAEKDKTPEQSAEHRVVPDRRKTRGFAITGLFQDRMFTNTWEGEVLMYELSQASLDKLNATAKAIFAAFPQAWNPDDAT
jgi:hypothetical protein